MLDSVVALLWVLAFFFALPVVEPYEISRLLCVSCALAATVICYGIYLPGGVQVPKSPIVTLVLLFWGLAALSLIWSVSFYVSAIALATFSLMPLGMLSAFAVSARPACMRIFMAGASLIFAGLALWVFAQLLFFPEFLVSGHVRHPFANPNSYAAVLSLGFFAALGIFLDNGNKATRYAAGLLTVLTLAAIALISGRGALLAMGAGLAVFIWFLRPAIKKQSVSFISVFVLAALLFLAVSALAAGNAGGAYVISKIQGGESLGLSNRLPVWLSGLRMIGDHIWLGSGIGSFFLMYGEYRMAADKGSSGLMAHSDILQFWAELGILAPLCFAALLVLFPLRFLKSGNARQSAFPVAVFCALFAMALHSFVTFNFYVPAALVLAGLYSGYWLHVSGDKRVTVKWTERLPPVFPQVLLLCFAAAVIFFLHGFLYSEYLGKRAGAMAKAGMLESYADDINRANEASFGLNPRPYIQAANLHITLMESEQPGIDQASVAAMLAQAEALSPRLSDIYYHKGRLFMLRDNTGHAETSFQKSLSLNPLHVQARIRLARLYLEAEKPRDAAYLLREGLQWPARNQAHTLEYKALLSLAEKQGGGEDKSREQ